MHDGRSLHGRHRDAPNGRVYDRGVVPTLVIRLLGPPEIERDGIVSAPPRGHKAWPCSHIGCRRSARSRGPTWRSLGLTPAVGRCGPFVALSVAASGAPPESAGLGHVDLVAQGLAILALLAWTGAIGAAGGALMRQRDVQ